VALPLCLRTSPPDVVPLMTWYPDDDVVPLMT
jgi:hypothetical protein